MAPPKRKTGGRVTPKANPRATPGGSRIDQRAAAAGEPGATDAGSARRPAASATTASAGTTRVAASSRYTPKVDRHQLESPAWVPALMLGFFILGGLAIMSRYLIWDSSNLPMVLGLAFLLAGLYTATKWR